MVLSKTNFMLGLKCPRALWFKINQPATFPPLSESTRAVLNEGNRVGELARQLYPDGILLERDSDPRKMHAESIKALRLGVPLFESGMLDERAQLYALPDILFPVGENVWDLYEVKSSTSVKPYHPKDVAFQRTVYESAGLRIRNTYLMHVNPDYVKDGPLDLTQYFVAKNINREVARYLPHIRELVEGMQNIMSSENPPEIAAGQSCGDCSMDPICWSDLPPFNVFTLFRGRSVAFDLRSREILKIGDIPEDYSLNHNHSVQREAIISGQPQINKGNLKAFLDQIKFPVYFLDFETIAPAVPIFNGTRPYEAVPVQFSLHTLRNRRYKPDHVSFLADGSIDPRPDILLRLQKLLGSRGTILAYFADYEQRCISHMVRSVPEFKQWQSGITPRFVDLWKPFGNFDYYHPLQQGSTSMKKVLPVFSDKTYKGLDIAEGMGARMEYMRAAFDPTCTEEEKQQIFRALEEYCGLDTYGMIEILRGLNGIK